MNFLSHCFIFMFFILTPWYTKSYVFILEFRGLHTWLRPHLSHLAHQDPWLRSRDPLTRSPSSCTHQARSCLQVFVYIVRHHLYSLTSWPPHSGFPLTCLLKWLFSRSFTIYLNLHTHLFNLSTARKILILPFLRIFSSLGFPEIDS